jgi:hypothetical protein
LGSVEVAIDGAARGVARPQGQITINFFDGKPSAMRSLLTHALRHYAGKEFEMMVPVHQGKHARALDILREAGFTSWSDFNPDVFAYEMVL